MPQKNKFKKINELPAGKYYIGDFCYLISKLKEDSVSYELLDIILDSHPLTKTGMHQDKESGICFYFAADFGGDGTYETYVNGRHKLDLAVDSGSIGAFPYPHASEFKSKGARSPAGQRKTPKHTLTRTFKEDFECRQKYSKIFQGGANLVAASSIGDVVVDFRGTGEE